MSRMELVGPPGHVRSRTDVTARTRSPYLVRVRTIDWPERENFVAEFDRLKKKAGIKRDTEVADRAVVSHTSISSWKSGRQRPSFGALKKIAPVLRTTARSLASIAGIDYLDTDEDAEAPALPVEIEELLTNYGYMSEVDQADMLQRIAWVNEWAESRLAKAGPTAGPHQQTG